MEAIRREIVLGSTVCEKIKRIYHPDEPWAACHRKVADGYSELKRIASRFYISMSSMSVAHELSRYGDQDIMEMLETDSVTHGT